MTESYDEKSHQRKATVAEDLEMLGAMALLYHANTGNPPTTIKQIADHWYEMERELVDDHHIHECIWLREIENRPDAPTLLTQAIDRQRATGMVPCPCCHGPKWLRIVAAGKVN